MPITRRQFELGIDQDLESWMLQIYQHLEGHVDAAFSLKELEDAFGVSEQNRDAYENFNEWYSRKTRFSTALERLLALNSVSEREVAGVRYYATGRYALKDILSGKVDPTSSPF